MLNIFIARKEGKDKGLHQRHKRYALPAGISVIFFPMEEIWASESQMAAVKRPEKHGLYLIR